MGLLWISQSGRRQQQLWVLRLATARLRPRLRRCERSREHPLGPRQYRLELPRDGLHAGDGERRTGIRYDNFASLELLRDKRRGIDQLARRVPVLLDRVILLRRRLGFLWCRYRL